MEVMSSNTTTLVKIKHSLVPRRFQDVRRLELRECKAAALSLAHSFASDDFCRYLSDGGDTSDETKWKLHVDIMTYMTTAHCLGGIVTTLGSDYEAVAVWEPPGKDLDDWWTLIRSGMWKLYFQLSAEGKKRFFDETLPLLHDTKESVLGERNRESYYLIYLGTKPSVRGRGYAKKLLEDMFKRADAENRPVYLESSSVANNAYYKKLGFEIRREVYLKRAQVPVRLSIMVREPKPVEKSTYRSGVREIRPGVV